MSVEGNNNRNLDVTTPEFCFSCGIKTKEWIEKNPEAKWIRVDLLPGISIFACPQCNTASFNANLQENNVKVMTWQKEDLERRIIGASSLIDPKTNKVVDLKAVK